jgi:hypothetical protein
MFQHILFAILCIISAVLCYVAFINDDEVGYENKPQGSNDSVANLKDDKEDKSGKKKKKSKPKAKSKSKSKTKK